MSDEQVVETPPVEPTPVEAQAMQMGWKPKEQYEGDPEKWVTADIFVARAPLFEKIDEQHRHTKNLQKKLEFLEKTLQDQAAHTERVRATEYKRALEALKQEKRVALAEEDLVRADELQDKIEEVKEAQRIEEAAKQVAPPQPAVNEAFVAWSQENQWYKLDAEMREFADAMAIIEHNKGKTPEEVLKSVTEKVRKNFKDSPHFRNPNKDKAPAVEAQSGGAPRGKASGFKPTAEQREIARRFAATGIMSEEQYYKDLQAQFELE